MLQSRTSSRVHVIGNSGFIGARKGRFEANLAVPRGPAIGSLIGDISPGGARPRKPRMVVGNVDVHVIQIGCCVVFSFPLGESLGIVADRWSSGRSGCILRGRYDRMLIPIFASRSRVRVISQPSQRVVLEAVAIDSEHARDARDGENFANKQSTYGCRFGAIGKMFSVSGLSGWGGGERGGSHVRYL